MVSGLDIKFLGELGDLLPIVAKDYVQEWSSPGHPLDLEETISRFEEGLMATSGVPCAFVALKNDYPVAFLILKPSDDCGLSDPQEDGVWLSGFHVLRAHRNQGIGSTLLKHASEYAHELGHDVIHLWANETDYYDNRIAVEYVGNARKITGQETYVYKIRYDPMPV